MTLKEKIMKLQTYKMFTGEDTLYVERDDVLKLLEQEPKIKVLEFDEIIRRLGTVDVYQARAWATLVRDLKYLELEICEVEE